MEMAPEWPQRRWIPAFGEWNYPRDGDGDGAGAAGTTTADWPLTPCFDAFVRTAAPPPAPKHNNMWARPNARRKRIPAFGEWNHHHGGSDDGDGSWPAAAVTPFFELATVHRTPNKTRWDGVTGVKLPTAAEAHGRGRRSKVADDSRAYAARRSCFTVAKPVDDDLYGIPPEMAFEKSSKKGGLLRILLIRYCCCLCPRGSC